MQMGTRTPTIKDRVRGKIVALDGERQCARSLRLLNHFTAAEIEEIINRDPVDWRPIGPFAPDDPWSFKNAFDRVTGLRIPPWILPRTYAQALWDFPDRPELKFVNGNATGLMEVPHIIAARPPNFIGKATNRLDEASISELSEAGEFVNNYAPMEGKYVPAERAKELLTPLLFIKPAKKAVAEAEQEYARYWSSWSAPAENELSETEIEVINFLLSKPPFSRYYSSIDEWVRHITNYLVTDHGRLTLTQVAEQLGVSKSYLSDVISGRYKTSQKIPLQQIIDNNLPLRSDHFGVMPENPYYLPVPDPEETDEELFDLMAGFDQAQQLTDGSLQSYENSEACKSMLFNLWEHKTLERPEEIKGPYTVIGEYAGQAFSEIDFATRFASFDYESIIAALDNSNCTLEALDDDDEILDVGDIE